MPQISSQIKLPPGFVPYNKEGLKHVISSISIEKVGGSVITKIGPRVLSTTSVSPKYEIFDLKSWFLQKIDEIENNFHIKGYRLKLKGGIQRLDLISDTIEVSGIKYNKTFFLLSSSDKSRALRLDIGLSCIKGTHQIVFSGSNFSLYKKHVSGLNNRVEDVSKFTLTGETFKNQVESINRLVGQKVLLSNVHRLITSKGGDVDHKKFDRFKYLYLRDHRKSEPLTPLQEKILSTRSQKIVWTSDNDIQVCAWKVFLYYMTIFSQEDSYIVSKETQKILEITNCFIRDKRIEQVLNLL